MRTLLIGGAGYVGVHTAVALLEAGHEVLIVDDLSATSPEAVRRVQRITGAQIPLLVSDARDRAAVASFVRAHAPVDAIIHFAGLKSVAESVADPLRYYDVNIATAVTALEVMRLEGIERIVFSSSATVYGAATRMPITEDTPTPFEGVNPYGKTKIVIEELLRDVSVASPAMRAVSLRYFNPVGAHPSGLIGEDPHGEPTNLMPLIARVAAGRLPRLQIFGDDYDTVDGTGVRDYIHISDLAEGHVAAVVGAHPGFEAINLGTGRGTSVRELISAFEAASQTTIPTQVRPRRPGDAGISYADPAKALDQLGWSARRSIDEACVDFWAWQTRNPTGYEPADH